jgi:hypothetical protein
MFTGIVRDSQVRTNNLTGLAFEWMAVESFAATIEVLVPLQPTPIQTGEVVQGTGWLVSHRLPVNEL